MGAVATMAPRKVEAGARSRTPLAHGDPRGDVPNLPTGEEPYTRWWHRMVDGPAGMTHDLVHFWLVTCLIWHPTIRATTKRRSRVCDCRRGCRGGRGFQNPAPPAPLLLFEPPPVATLFVLIPPLLPSALRAAPLLPFPAPTVAALRLARAAAPLPSGCTDRSPPSPPSCPVAGDVSFFAPALPPSPPPSPPPLCRCAGCPPSPRRWTRRPCAPPPLPPLPPPCPPTAARPPPAACPRSPPPALLPLGRYSCRPRHPSWPGLP